MELPPWKLLAAVIQLKPGGRVRTFVTHDLLALVRQPLLKMVFGTKVIMSFSNLEPSVKISWSPCHWPRSLSKLVLPFSQLGDMGYPRWVVF